MKISMDKIDELLTRGVEKIYPSKDELEKVLRSVKKLKLYQGFDPSMPSLHLGNYVGVVKLKQFQELGHKVIFLVGDFTGMIGDPTDKSATRRKLTREETIENSKSWKKQIEHIINFEGKNPAQIMFNSSWLDKVSFKDLIEISSNFTVQQMIERDFFQKRLSEGKPIFLHEFLYPIAVSIDCVEMDVDLEIGGSDQTFNMLAGRTLMKAVKNKEKYVLATKLLVDNQGNKVGKTTGNALFLDQTPENIYGGIMSFPDEVIDLAFELLTFVPMEEIHNLDSKNKPMEAKKRLAREVVAIVKGKESAINAQAQFEQTVQKRETPDDIERVSIKKLSSDELDIVDLISETNLTQSRGEAKRLIEQNAIEINGVKQSLGARVTIHIDDIIKVGKRKYLKIGE